MCRTLVKERMLMKFDKQAYSRDITKNAPGSPVVRNCFAAFWVGGVICCVGQGLLFLYRACGMSEEMSGVMVTVSLIFLSAVLTALGIFDNIARYAGAGTLVPVTGFANAVVSPALDTKSEGWVMGLGANMFKVAGPVIVFGTVAGGVYGVVLWLVGLLGGKI